MSGQGQILRYFEFTHLPSPLLDVSLHFSELAHRMSSWLPDGSEKSVALRKLLEAKDAAVRAALDLPPREDPELRADRPCSHDEQRNDASPIAKVEYQMIAGGISTMYVDQHDGNVVTGTDKYSDDPVRAVWNGTMWLEEDEEDISHG